MYKKHSIEERLLAVKKCLRGQAPKYVGRKMGLHKVAEPYWREAIARCLLEKWNELGKTKYKDKKDEEIVAVMCTCFVEH